MIESMYFVVVLKEARAEVQIKVEKGFRFNILGLEFSHFYNVNGDEGITIRHEESGQYTKAFVKIENTVGDDFKPEYYVNGVKIVFKAIETSHFMWHHECRCWGKK